MISKKVEVSRDYLLNILRALEDAKGFCEVYGFKNTFNKHISKTKSYIEKN